MTTSTDVRITFAATVFTDYIEEVVQWFHNGASPIPGVRDLSIDIIPSVDDDSDATVLLDFHCDSPRDADIRAISTFLDVEDSLGNSVPECVLIFTAVLHR